MTRLVLTDVTRVYPGPVDVHALREVDLTIEQGDFVAIEGPSGAGKSTLLNVLALLDSPTTGSYTVDGIETTNLSDAEAARLRCETFGFVFQSFHLLPARAVIDNVMLGMAYHQAHPAQARQRALEAIEFVGLGPRADFAVKDLSGGERQRVALARAVCSQAPVLLADEPTGNLDSASTALVLDLLERLNADGVTVVVVTHDAEVAARAHERIRVIDGVVTRLWPGEDSDRAVITEASQPHPRSRPEDALPAAPAATEIPAPRLAEVPDGETAVHGRPGSLTTASRLRPSFLWRDVIQAVTTDPGRTLRLVSIVALAVMLGLTTLGLAQSARYQVADTFDAQRNRRVAVGTDDSAVAAELASAPDSEGLSRVSEIPGVDGVLAIFEYPVAETSTSSHGQKEETRFFAVEGAGDLDALLTTSTQSTADSATAPPSIAPDSLGEDEVLIGSQAASQLRLGPTVGSPTIWVNGVPYAVAGIVTSAGLRSELLTGVIMTPAGANRLAAAQAAGLELRTQPGAAAQISKVAAIAWTPEHADATRTEAPPDPRTLRAKIETSVRATMLTLTGVAVVTGLAALANAMSTTVRQRTGELALRRAIGARRVHLRLLIGSEAIILGAIGGFLGALGSVLAVLAVTIAQHWQPIIDPLALPLGLLGGITAGALSAMAASRQAGRIRPSQALR